MTATGRPAWVDRTERMLGPVGTAQPLSGSAWRASAGSNSVVVKTGPGVVDEAAGLVALAGVDRGPPVPEVLLVEEEVLVTSWVRQVDRTESHLQALGGALAALHSAPRSVWGGGSSWIGNCRVDASEATTGAEFYGRRLAELAGRCGLSEEVGPVLRRLDELLDQDAPVLVHGDLWWGNVLWGDDGRGWLIDPSCHGGHAEEDLAMLDLFGSVPAPLMRSYDEVRPCREGWQLRRPLFSLYPLLVHTILFGGSYRSQAVAAARFYR